MWSSPHDPRRIGSTYGALEIRARTYVRGVLRAAHRSDLGARMLQEYRGHDGADRGTSAWLATSRRSIGAASIGRETGRDEHASSGIFSMSRLRRSRFLATASASSARTIQARRRPRSGNHASGGALDIRYAGWDTPGWEDGVDKGPMRRAGSTRPRSTRPTLASGGTTPWGRDPVGDDVLITIDIAGAAASVAHRARPGASRRDVSSGSRSSARRKARPDSGGWERVRRYPHRRPPARPVAVALRSTRGSIGVQHLALIR